MEIFREFTFEGKVRKYHQFFQGLLAGAPPRAPARAASPGE